MHTSVLLNEVIENLEIKPKGHYADLTGGFGGHSQKIFENLDIDGVLYIVDQDLDAINFLKDKFKDKKNVKIFHQNHSSWINQYKDQFKLDGLLADLGVSSKQLDDEKRGFSFMRDGPLDMRMNQDQEFSAYDVVKDYSLDDLIKIFKEYGNERHAFKIARAIVHDREIKEFKTTLELEGLAYRVLGKYYRNQKIHPATRIFQALRIEVNGELQSLENLLNDFPKILADQGYALMISFHSLEDRLVKNTFRDLKQKSGWNLITKKPIIPTEDEVKNNVRSRSAKLRVIQRLD